MSCGHLMHKYIGSYYYTTDSLYNVKAQNNTDDYSSILYRTVWNQELVIPMDIWLYSSPQGHAVNMLSKYIDYKCIHMYA